jgi:hypothetical protein
MVMKLRVVNLKTDPIGMHSLAGASVLLSPWIEATTVDNTCLCKILGRHRITECEDNTIIFRNTFII